MDAPISSPRNDHEREQALGLLKQVYVGEGYTSSDRAEAFMRRATFEEGGDLLLAHGAAGAVVGVVLHLHTNGPLGQVARDGEAEFRMLAVAPEARGKRIGEALVRACIERAMNDGARAVVLWSQPTMPAAHRLYERLGFVRAPERDQEDVRGFTRLVFRKSLGCS
ncbi:MAG: GNAT family N-acetyltransferase [Flavobacteriales bacterium]|nr:GNAT family N-acetyltransferase [Flavobacteriales bacterium]